MRKIIPLLILVCLIWGCVRPSGRVGETCCHEIQHATENRILCDAIQRAFDTEQWKCVRLERFF